MELPEKLLSQMWNEADWEKAEKKLDEIKTIQQELVEDNKIKCLAMRRFVTFC